MPPKRKKRKNLANTDSIIDEAFNILKKSASNIEFSQQTPDECTTYGTHIRNKLRNYTPKTRSQAQPSTSYSVDFNSNYETSDGSSLESTPYLG